MAFKVVFISALVALAASVASGLVISSEPLTHNQAAMFCATHGESRLADVNSANQEQVIHELGGQAAWIGSWDYNFYSGQCLKMTGYHIGAADCEEKHVAVCNSPHVYKSTGEVVGGDKDNTKAAGARPSHRSHHKPCVVPTESSSSSCSSSGAECLQECVPRYEYVYLTRSVSQIYTSVTVTTVYTSTSTSTSYTATVEAYVVSSPSG